MPRTSRSFPLTVAALAGAVAGAAAGIFISRNFFDAEHRLSRRIDTSYGVGDQPFNRTMSHLLGPALVEGNEVRLLRNGREIFPAMLAAIRAAQCSITLENFRWSEGLITAQFADALGERAAAGVRVHFLQDAIGCQDSHGPSMRAVKNSRVELELFHGLKFTRLNYRTHRKLLVIDGRTGFIGGVGLDDAWNGDGTQPGHWRDTHYQVRGPVVAQVQQALVENWTQTRGVILHGDDYFPALDRAGEQTCQVFRSSESDTSGSVRVMLLFSIAAARRRIQIANAYFIPDDHIIATLVEARCRGVAIEIITPGEDIDKPLVRYASRARWEPLLAAGVRIHEFQPARLHCKYMIVDDCWLSVGSANFDNRSLRLNDEANLNVLDGDFARTHSAMFAEDLARSREITLAEWKRRPLWEKAIGNATTIFRSQL